MSDLIASQQLSSLFTPLANALNAGSAKTFSLGSVIFQGTEVPEQLLGLGGREALVVHEFPGGIRTIQTYGAFPTPIHWSGVLTGTLAFERSQTIDRMRVAGLPVPLVYGPFAWAGLVKEYVPEPRHAWYVPYRLLYEPLVDLSGAATPPLQADIETVQLHVQLGLMSNSLLGPLVGLLPLPAVLAAPVQGLITQSTLALRNSNNGKVSGFQAADATAVSTSAQAVMAAASPLLQDTDSTQSSPAQDTYSRASVVNTIVTSSANQTQWTVHVVNPNLWQLAAQYYGDATQWRTIANANGLTSPLQLGTYTLTIPPKP